MWSTLSGVGSAIDVSVESASGADYQVLNRTTGAGLWQELGVYRFTAGQSGFVELSDARGGAVIVDAIRLELLSGEPIALEIVPSSLRTAAVSYKYMAELKVIGGVAPYSWSITDGQLPSGLLLSASAGEISGVPEVPTSSTFTVQVTDGPGEVATKQLSPTVEAQVPPEDIIVDDGDVGTSRTGVWNYRTHSDSYSGDYLWGGPGQVNTYRFVPTVEVAGYYRVYASWLEHSNRSEQVAFDIIHSDGSDTVTVDQRIAGRQWNELGVYYFQAGSGYFEVSDRNGLYAVADAVKLEYVSH